MSLLSNNKKSGKKDNKQKSNIPGSNTFIKSNKAAGNVKKPVRTGGTRGS